MKKYIIVFWAGVAMLMAGCNSWLDVQPDDQISEDKLFSTPQGFRNAINGIYIDLNKSELYGKSLTYHWLEVLAQSYAVGKDHSGEKYATYSYHEATPKTAFASTWNSMYKQIGNINLLLENLTGKNAGVLDAMERDWLEGEALALRAMMHFDLFRLFGPVYIQDSTSLSLPYYKNYDGIVERLLPAREFKDQIILDLNRAEVLLKHDPVVTQGTLMSTDAHGRVINRYRGLRMNYYAVLALQARVALYVNIPERALAYAQSAIEGAERWFPFARAEQWVFEPENPDRILSSECYFSLQNTKRNGIWRGAFESTLSSATILSPEAEVLENLYQTDDWRLRGWWERAEKENVNPEEPKRIVYSLLKYRDIIETSKVFNTMMPLLRRSEMHYIVAEVLVGQGLLPEACQELQKVRNARGMAGQLESDLNVTQLQEEIRKEYQREFYGEGQLFFYYKRVNAATIPDGMKAGATISMSATKYVLPLPESELKFRD